jgi:hypothetical protein
LPGIELDGTKFESIPIALRSLIPFLLVFFPLASVAQPNLEKLHRAG